MENQSEVIEAWIEQVDLAGPFQSSNAIRALLASAPAGAPGWLIAALRSHLILLELDENPLRWTALLLPERMEPDDVVTAWLDFWRHVVTSRETEFAQAFRIWIEKVREFILDPTATDLLEVPHPFSSRHKDFEGLMLRVERRLFPTMADDILEISREIEVWLDAYDGGDEPPPPAGGSTPRGPK